MGLLMKEESFLTVDQVAAKLQVRSTTIREWIRKGQLPAVKLGRIYRIEPEQLERFIKSKNTVKT